MCWPSDVVQNRIYRIPKRLTCLGKQEINGRKILALFAIGYFFSNNGFPFAHFKISGHVYIFISFSPH